jgi:hypothetical protein
MSKENPRTIFVKMKVSSWINNHTLNGYFPAMFEHHQVQQRDGRRLGANSASGTFYGCFVGRATRKMGDFLQEMVVKWWVNGF